MKYVVEGVSEMSDSIAEQLEILSTHLAEIYFNKQDNNQLSFYIDDHVTWYEAAYDKISRGKANFEEWLARKEHNDHLMETPYVECVHANSQGGIVVLKVKLQSSVSALMSIWWITIIWTRDEKKLWKILHIHSTNIQNDDDQLPDIEIDHMTMIHNMEGFVARVTNLMNKYPNQPYAIIKFGIRDFRYINRRHGYRKGDRVLQNIAKNLQSTCGEDETCGRIEKDTFAMLYRFKGKRQMAKRMDVVRKHLLDESMLFDLGMDVNFIAGIYIVPKEDKEHVKNMLDKALLAMQNVDSRQQGSHYIYFQEKMMEKQFKNSQIMEQAIQALHDEKFQLYIQPQFEVKTGKVIAGEALCRWEIRKGKFISPNEFIPLFEEHGLILEFDFYMLHKLCAKMQEWMKKGRTITPISVNQSRLHIEKKNYIKRFCEVVDHYGISHSDIAFELTESAFVEQNEKMIKLAKELHEHGFQLAIDDFGTGYASLNLLSIISADILKVDKSLIDSIHTKRGRAVLEKVIELAHQMNMMVICEGIENMEQLNVLRQLHCDTAQGFLMGKPIPASEFEKIWIK